MNIPEYTPWGIRFLDSKHGPFVLAMVTGLLISLASDVLSLIPVGIMFSVLLFTLGLVFIRKRVYIFFLFLSLFGFYEFPRGILDLYDSVGGYAYNVITTVPLAGIPLHYWLVVAAGAMGVVWSKFRREGMAKAVILPAMLLLIGLGGMAIAYISNGLPLESARFIKIDMKLPIMIAMGILLSALINTPSRRRDMVSFFFILPMILGVRGILALAFDFMNGQINLDLGTRGIFSGCVLAYILITGKSGWYKSLPCRILLYINLLTSSRGDLALEALLIAIGLVVGIVRNRRFAFRIGLELIGLLGIALSAISVINPRLIDFIYWKASEFVPGQELSGSGKVRVEEIRNIWHLISENPNFILFGKGFGAHFKFDPYAFPSNELLDRMSYSDDQIAAGNFYAPHTPIGYMLLKFGIFGLGVYLWIPLRIIIWLRRHATQEELMLIPLVAVLGLSYFWRPSECLLMGVLLGLALTAQTIKTQPNPIFEAA